jgi:hypothetical protein
MSTNMTASRTSGRRRRLKTYEEDRVCSTEGCITQLSRYNSSTECHVHAPRIFPRLRGVVQEA